MLIQTEVGRAEVVAKQVATLPGVLSSEYVTGPYDVVVRVGGNDSADLTHQHRSQRSAGHRNHPHPDLPDRRCRLNPLLPQPSNPRRTARRGPS